MYSNNNNNKQVLNLTRNLRICCGCRNIDWGVKTQEWIQSRGPGWNMKGWIYFPIGPRASYDYCGVIFRVGTLCRFWRFLQILAEAWHTEIAAFRCGCGSVGGVVLVSRCCSGGCCHRGGGDYHSQWRLNDVIERSSSFAQHFCKKNILIRVSTRQADFALNSLNAMRCRVAKSDIFNE